MEQHTNPQFLPHQEPIPAQYAPRDFMAAPAPDLADTVGAGEKVTFWRDSRLSNLELLRATFIKHAFAPHTHEGYAIGVIEKGAERFKYRKAVHVAPQGSIVVINPEEMHTGEAVSQQGWSYRMLYPEIALLQRAAADAVEKPSGVPFFPEPVIYDPALASMLSRMHAALAISPSELERESVLVWTLAHLIRRHAATPPLALTSPAERAHILKVRAYLEEHATENVSLDQLARLVHLSPFYLLRVFRDTVGLPPHSYLTQVRVARARHLISASMPLADVADAVGFTDQSHLNRHFKALVGVTPGQYARGSR
ncbi:MAG TPA: AraC family transcriptional regulator [Ktedonobacteraceae bacterium]